MAAPEKYESDKIGHKSRSNPILSDTEMLYPYFQAQFQIRVYFHQFNVNLFQE